MTAHTADEIIEAMARAIYETAPESGFDYEDERTFWRASDSYWPDIVWAPWTRQARAAYAECLRMLREPTQAQEDAGFIKDGDEERAAAGDHWRAMIDARLKELG